MKKQVYYKAINTDRRKRFPDNVEFVKSEGYIHTFTDKAGNTLQVAMEYNRSAKMWRATELTTGLGSYPLEAKSQEELLKELSHHDFSVVYKATANLILAKLLKLHKEREEANDT